MPEYKVTYEDWVKMASTIKEFNDQMKEENRRRYIWYDDVTGITFDTEWSNEVEDERPAWETL